MQILQNYSGYNHSKMAPGFGFNYETHRAVTKKAFEYVPELTQAIEKFASNSDVKHNFLNFTSVIDYLKSLAATPQSKGKFLNRLAINSGGLESLFKKSAQSNELQAKFRQEIADASMLPDLLKTETGFHTNRHFYFPPTPQKQRISFGPNEDKNNARFAFEKHITNALIPFSDQKHLIPKETGMALHFLQDMAVPMHTRRQGVYGKAVDFLMHRKFELNMLENQEKLLKNYKPGFIDMSKEIGNNPVTHSVHTDTFLANCRFSTQPDLQVRRSNKKDWEQIQQSIFNRAVDSTVLELKNIAKILEKLG